MDISNVFLKKGNWKNSKDPKIEEYLSILWSIFMAEYFIDIKTYVSKKYLSKEVTTIMLNKGAG